MGPCESILEPSLAHFAEKRLQKEARQNAAYFGGYSHTQSTTATNPRSQCLQNCSAASQESAAQADGAAVDAIAAVLEEEATVRSFPAMVRMAKWPLRVKIMKTADERERMELSLAVV
mmetsp:Transcript_15003/g.32201  ORF Transcript_15003/g.32201 Transcript_15003/m.32201 type:complete len:118 (-) Transcript_15003:514-867(-)